MVAIGLAQAMDESLMTIAGNLTAWRPVHVRKIGPWWGWYCQLPDCLDSAFAYGDPGRAADAGREHHRLWHTDLPVFARYRT